jgi:transposase-like protein
MSLRKIIKNRASFPNDEAAFKLLYLFIRQRWRETASSDWTMFFHRFVSFDYQTINSNDKTVSVH